MGVREVGKVEVREEVGRERRREREWVGRTKGERGEGSIEKVKRREERNGRGKERKGVGRGGLR